ncbi:MAG: heavy-metal-associated domain-containing protein [Methylococcales bacterium]
MDKIVLQVEGLKCGGCESSVKSALEAVHGVTAVRPNHKLNRVEIEFDASLISIQRITEIIVGRGYTVKN